MGDIYDVVVDAESEKRDLSDILPEILRKLNESWTKLDRQIVQQYTLVLFRQSPVLLHQNERHYVTVSLLVFIEHKAFSYCIPIKESRVSMTDDWTSRYGCRDILKTRKYRLCLW